MPKRGANISLASYDDIFKTDQDREKELEEKVQLLPAADLIPFRDHPFKVLHDQAMDEMIDSVKEHGVLSPLIVRPKEGGTYEIVSGHRRQYAAMQAGLENVPAIVRDMDDDAAILLMVDSNLQREKILPSERAFAYKMKMEAMKHQGERNDLTSRRVVGKFEVADEIGAELGESGRQVQRYIRLTNLVPEVLDMVDVGKIAFNPAVELSYLKTEEQRDFLKALDYAQTFPSLSQAQRIKKLSQQGMCTFDNEAYTSPNTQLLANAFDSKIRFVRQNLPMLNKALELQLTDNEIAVVAMLLETHDNTERKKRIGLILMGHGSSTASSIAAFANSVLLTNAAQAVDMPISLSPQKALKQLCSLVEQIDDGKGVIILTDSDSYEYYEKQILQESGVRCRVAPFLNVSIALEISKAITTTDDDLDKVFHDSMENY